MHVCLTIIHIAITFHELIHHLTKAAYGPQVTSVGCGGYSAIFGESGEGLETLLLGGIVVGLWKTWDLGEMEKVQQLLLVYHGQEWVLCKKYLQCMVICPADAIDNSHSSQNMACYNQPSHNTRV